jgi:hypothetical protein
VIITIALLAFAAPPPLAAPVTRAHTIQADPPPGHE